MPTYDKIAATDSNYNFPPEILNALTTTFGPAWAPQRNVPASQDLNTFTVPGNHRITTPDTQTIVNLPPGMYQAGMLENLQSGTGTTSSWWFQRITQYGDTPRMWWRTSRNTSGGWNDWQEVNQSSSAITELHVFLAVGQSNMSGRGLPAPALTDNLNPRILQYGATRKRVESATIPLDMHDTATGLSPATTFARAYLRSQPPNVGVLLIPAAHGSTGFTSSTSTYTWSPNVALDPALNLPALAVAQTNSAIAAAKSAGYMVSLEGILWHQGENNSTMSQTAYSVALDGLISYFRTQLGKPKLPFIVGQMTPESIASVTGRVNIDAAHQDTPNRVPYSGFASATIGGYNSGDTTHMSRIGVEFLGSNYAEAFYATQATEDIKPRLKTAEAAIAAIPAQISAGTAQATANYIANDPTVVQAAADMAASNSNLVPKWKANTAYNNGMQVVAPNGDIITKNGNGSTGATFSMTGWTASDNTINKLDASANRAQQVTTKPQTDAPSTYPLGVSWFGVGTADAWSVGLATVTTVRNAGSRTYQLMVGKTDASLNIRAETDGDVWTAWVKMASDALVDATNKGLMSSADKTKLDGATANATASTLVYRNSGGDSNFRRVTATDQPTAADQLTRKDYVDAAVVNITAMGANQDLNTYLTTGTFHQGSNSYATLPLNYPEASAGLLEVFYAFANSQPFVYQRYMVYGNGGSEIYWRTQYGPNAFTAWQKVANSSIATAAVDGLMAAADKAILDGASTTTVNNTLAKRTAAGNLYANTFYMDAAQVPTANAATRKDYVDGAIGAIAGGAIAKLVVGTASAAVNTTETLFLELTGVSVKANRNYLIKVSLDVQGVTAGNVGVTANIKYGGTAASSNGNLAESKTVWSAPVSALNNSNSIVILYTPTADATQRFKLTGVRVSGTSDFKIAACDMAIFDMGSTVV